MQAIWTKNGVSTEILFAIRHLRNVNVTCVSRHIECQSEYNYKGLLPKSFFLLPINKNAWTRIISWLGMTFFHLQLLSSNASSFMEKAHYEDFSLFCRFYPLFVSLIVGPKQNAGLLLTPVSDTVFMLFHMVPLVLLFTAALLTIFWLVEIIQQPIRFFEISG